MYYRLNEKGSILDWSDSEAPYADDCLFTNKKVVVAWDSNTYIEGEEPEKPQELIESEVLSQAKQERAKEVSKITVEVDGLIFDGDEDSQTRMARTITASKALGLPEDSTISWAMADTNANKVEQVTISQLSKALYLAGCKQSELWCKPYGVTGTTQTGLEYLNSLSQ